MAGGAEPRTDGEGRAAILGSAVHEGRSRSAPRAEREAQGATRGVAPARRDRAGLMLVLLAAVTLASATPAAAQFVRITTNPRNVLEGNWQSCQEANGSYAERVYDHVVNGVPQFEVHLGPRREFGIFEGVQDAHREHASDANLLKPYRVPLQGMRARQRWEIPSLKLAFTVTLGGGARTDCESWYILLEPLDKPSQ